MSPKKAKIWIGGFAVSICLLALTLNVAPETSAHAQQPTGSIATVTGTPSGPIVSVDLSIPYVNVYAGPSTFSYPAIGVLIAGQQIPALGYSEDQTWIQIYYPGVPDSVAWVYGPYMKFEKIGDLPILAPPSTPTPASTPTINPTLEAAFIIPVTPGRLPTFTAPPPLNVTTFEDQSQPVTVPMGLLIFGLGFVGALGVILSFLRGR
ncbi:MAG: SH3 domain-containing protein [Anaerolineales bacterium]|nr:SH3 domain-containing protein [Anaerolineales bacterium]